MRLRILFIALFALPLAVPLQLGAQPAQFIGAPEPANPAKPSPLSAEDQRAVFTLPPGFEIELVASEEPGIGKFITVDWDQKGRMWTMTAFDYPVDGNENADQAKALYASPGKDKVLIFDTPFAPGVQRPRVFAEGLAIPLGILPYKNGVYAQHGQDIVFLSDNDGDGKADKRKVILSGFGVQDSHLFPHQFTRAPGNWIWMAQGAFNSGKVRTARGDEIQFDATRMAKFRYDGSAFEITSQGPCNIWGLVLGAEGETWIQEANDYGYPAMPFHEFANYPGCSDRLFKSYAPEFPGTADFRVGGTGLSGLALSDKTGAWPEPYADIMYVANPITRRINSIKIHRDGPRYRLERLPDLVASGDEMFRPVSIQIGPDGCLYIVDWYNKIISHNEVPRNHPDRDKQRGRIWRVRHKDQKPFDVPDFTKLPGDELLARLGGPSLRQSHLAWQTIIDRELVDLAPKLNAIISDSTQTGGRRISALWALEGLKKIEPDRVKTLLDDGNRNVRREAVRALGEAHVPNLVAMVERFTDDPDPEVRAQVIRSVGALIAHPWSNSYRKSEIAASEVIEVLAKCAREPLFAPTAPATRNGKPVKVREAYEREFERYLVRLFLELQPEAVSTWLETDAAGALPTENQLLLALSISPRESASRVARLLPKLSRAPGKEEVLRLAEFPDEPGVRESLGMILQNPVTRMAASEALISVKTRLDSTKLKPLLTDVARSLISADETSRDLGLQLASGFQLAGTEPEIAALLPKTNALNTRLSVLRTLRELGSRRVDVFTKLITEDLDAQIRTEAVRALSGMKTDEGAAALLGIWAQLSIPQRRVALNQLAGTPVGAKAVLHAVESRTVSVAELDAAMIDKLQAVLGSDRSLEVVMQQMVGLFRPVLHLDGSEEAYSDADLTLDGPFTVETWVRLDSGIDNKDGILGAPGVLDMNFYDSRFRVWVGSGVNDAVVARRPVIPNVWTHIAVTRDEKGQLRIYQDGSLDAESSKFVPQKFEHLRIAWTAPKGGTAGALSEFRVWNRACGAEEIAKLFEREVGEGARLNGLVFHANEGSSWGTLEAGATILKSTNFPPVLTSAEAEILDAKFARFRGFAEARGNVERGHTLAAVCQACHLIQGQGNNLGPNLSGAGAMGTEALLRNILTPNAAVEPGYRIYRVEMTNGEILEGFLVSEEKDAVVLRIPGAEDRRISRRDMENGKFLRRSLMPEGLLDGMQPRDVSDLFAYLKTLK